MAILFFLICLFVVVGFSVIVWKDILHWLKGEPQEMENTPWVLGAKVAVVVADFSLIIFLIWALFFPH